ncbi:hypothetical protein RI054_26g109860 [Pseudoscourfieldia marina]
MRHATTTAMQGDAVCELRARQRRCKATPSANSMRQQRRCKATPSANSTRDNGDARRRRPQTRRATTAMQGDAVLELRATTTAMQGDAVRELDARQRRF